MNDKKIITDNEWGCNHSSFLSDKTIKACIVQVEDLNEMARALTSSVIDTSWMTSLDQRTQRAYQDTVNDTAGELVKIFSEYKEDAPLGAEFGETMVSMSSVRTLELLLEHKALPIAELWKPQKKQNEGFDFHTVCTDDFINFGEAKYSGVSNPHGKAITQAEGFIEEKNTFEMLFI